MTKSFLPILPGSLVHGWAKDGSIHGRGSQQDGLGISTVMLSSCELSSSSPWPLGLSFLIYNMGARGSVKGESPLPWAVEWGLS